MVRAYPNEEQLHATGVERSFIACLMKFPNLVTSAEAEISVDDIYSPNFHVIYKTILRMKNHYDMKQKRYIFSQELLSHWLESAPEEEQKIISRTVSKFQHLSTIQQAAGVDVESFGEYIKTLKETSSMIKAYRAAYDIQLDILKNASPNNARQILIDAEESISQIRIVDEESSIVRLGDCLDTLKEDIAFNKENKGRMGIWIPKFPRLMKVINGLRRTQFLILFARPKTGKSSLLLEVALSTGIQGIPVLYIDTEMTQKEQTSRAVANWSGVREWDIMGGEYIDDEEKKVKVQEHMDKLARAPIYYVAAKGGDVTKICALMKEFVAKHVGYEIDPKGNKRTKPCLIVYDWLKVAEVDRDVKEYQQLGLIATALNDTRRELDVPLIAGAQANRDGGMKNNSGVDAAYGASEFLADSDRLLRFCTCLIWLRRLNYEEMQAMTEIGETEPEKTYNQMIHVVDQRGGPVCMEGIGLNFTGATLSYEEKDAIDLKKYKQGKKKRTKEEKERILAEQYPEGDEGGDDGELAPEL
jgi:replicative DNA helicase|nr:MAG TPA: Helicase, ATPase, REPLICATION [Caudoviricetes sp.]